MSLSSKLNYGDISLQGHYNSWLKYLLRKFGYLGNLEKMARSEHWVEGFFNNMTSATMNTRNALLYRCVARGYCPVVQDNTIPETLRRRSQECEDSDIATVMSCKLSDITGSDSFSDSYIDITGGNIISGSTGGQQTFSFSRNMPSFLEMDSQLPSDSENSYCGTSTQSSVFDEGVEFPLSYWFSEVVPDYQTSDDKSSSINEIHNTDDDSKHKSPAIPSFSDAETVLPTKTQDSADDSSLGLKSAPQPVSFSDAETQWPENIPFLHSSPMTI